MVTLTDHSLGDWTDVEFTSNLRTVTIVRTVYGPLGLGETTLPPDAPVFDVQSLKLKRKDRVGPTWNDRVKFKNTPGKRWAMGDKGLGKRNKSTY